jgi:FkbM family methyltransferase
MLVKVALYISKLSIIRKNLFLKKFLKILNKTLSKLIYGKYKKISIANKYTFLIDSNFAFRNFENWSEGHNKGFKKLLDISKNKKVIFDIGAHIGLCSLPLSQLASKVISFEASPTNIKYLNKHIKINNNFNINVIPHLVGKENVENFDFYDVGDGSGIPSIANLNKKKKNIIIHHIKVKQIFLDDYVIKNSIIPNVLKIDVEGAEFNVLEGATKILREYRPEIIISLHPEHLRLLNRNIQEIYDYCDLYSYNLLSCIDEHKILSNELGLDEYYMKPI